MALFHIEPITDNVTIGLVIALVLALFTTLFGTRKLDATEHHPGLMLAIAFEAVIKLAAFLIIGLVICYGSFNGFGDIWQQASDKNIINHDNTFYNWGSLFTQTLVMMAAFLCMPRQFHTMMVEAHDNKSLAKSRWVFPCYLLLAGLFVLPLALAGKIIMDPSISADTYMLSVPLYLGYDFLSYFGFIGAISAATGMVIVSALTISIMVSNEWVMPVLLRTGRIKQHSFEEFSKGILNARRVIILLTMVLSWVFYTQVSGQNSLANLGQISFGVFIQILPGLVGGVYWKHGNKKGVYIGLFTGLFMCLYTLLKPVISQVNIFTNLEWLSEIHPSYNWILVSLIVNALFYIWGSLIFRPGVRERMQAGMFVNRSKHKKIMTSGSVTEQELFMLATRFVGEPRAVTSFTEFDKRFDPKSRHNKNANTSLVTHTELLLSGVIGTSSSSLVMRSVLEGRDMPLDDLIELIDEASTKIIHSQNLMHSAIEHASEGMSVIDEHYNLMAWNQRYADLFDYPANFLTVGKPICELIRFNSARGFCGEGDVEEHVARRLENVKLGRPYSFERSRSDGKVIKMQGNPMPNGGFVTTFSDITQYRLVERQLVKAKDDLEARVIERTQELSSANADLLVAKTKVEQANSSKTRFMAAIGHDLMQPLNAARLFTASLLQHEHTDNEVKDTVKYISDSLKSSGQLLTDLLDISKFESDAIAINKSDFLVSSLLDTFNVEFNAMAGEHSVEYRFVNCGLAIHSDINLLRRIIQNFLTNAFRYGCGGKVLLGCRRQGNNLSIEVWDQGCGIAEDKLTDIFTEFKRLESSATFDTNGLGLGLAIADRISKVLEHEISLTSEIDKGSMFRVLVPLVKNYKPEVSNANQQHFGTSQLAGVSVLCIDNEEKILIGLEQLLTRWQCNVLLAKSLDEAIELIDNSDKLPDIMLADYHLDNNKTGLDAMEALRDKYQTQIPGVLITADTRRELIVEVEQKNYKYMAKMIKPAALRALISGLV